MSCSLKILVESQQFAKLVAGDDILARGQIVGYLLALAEGCGAVRIVRSSFCHTE